MFFHYNTCMCGSGTTQRRTLVWWPSSHNLPHLQRFRLSPILFTQRNTSTTLSWLSRLFFLLSGIHLLVKSKAFQYTMCRCKAVHSHCCLLRYWGKYFPSSVTDAVVAINGVWILLETYTLNSTILHSLWTQMLEEGIFPYRCVFFILLQMDFLGSKLFPGVTLFFWQVSVLLSMFLTRTNSQNRPLHALSSGFLSSSF